MLIISQIKRILRNMIVVPKKFPLPAIAMIALFALSIYIISHSSRAMEVLGRYIITMVALFSLGTAVELWLDVSGRQVSRWLGRLVVIVFVGIYFLLLPKNFDNSVHGAFFVSQIVWHISFLLTIFLLPFFYTGRNEKNMPFYHQSLYTVLYIALGFIFALVAFLLGVLFLGSLRTLFDISINNGYEYWWAFCATIIGPTVVLANLLLTQKDIWNKETRCPKIIWSLANFILIPFVALYFVVLYAYTGKILLTWQWPNGRVSWLVLAFSVIGWLTYILVFVWRRQNKMFYYFVKIFPWVALPQVGILFVAWWWRVSAYGVTMNRYFLGAVGVWLTIIGVYAILTRRVKIIVLPAILFVILFVISFGWWGVVAVSEKSQLNRLQSYVSKYQLVDSKGNPQKDRGENLPQETQNEISSIIQYIVDMHGRESLQKVLPTVVGQICANEKNGERNEKLENDCSKWFIVTEVKKSLGINYSYMDNQPIVINNEFNFSIYNLENADYERTVKNIEGYDVLINDVYSSRADGINRLTLREEDGKKIVLLNNEKELKILVNGEVKDSFSFVDLAQPILDIYNKKGKLKKDDFTVVLSGQYVDIKVEVRSIKGKYEKDKVNKVKRFTGSVMVRFR